MLLLIRPALMMCAGQAAAPPQNPWAAPPQAPQAQAAPPARAQAPQGTAAAPAPTVSLTPAGRAPQQIAAPPPKPSNYAQAAGARPQAAGPQGGRGAGPARGPPASAPTAGAGRGAPHAEHKTAGAAPPIPVPQEDFDFDAMFKKFNKDELKKVRGDHMGAWLSAEEPCRESPCTLPAQNHHALSIFCSLFRCSGGRQGRRR
jgi:hypothetical protein